VIAVVAVCVLAVGVVVARSHGQRATGRAGAGAVEAPATSPTPTGVDTATAGATVRLEDVGGRCDGTFDNRAALAAGTARLRATGGVLSLPPGVCRVVQTARSGGVDLPTGVRLQGRSATSTLSLACDSASSYRELVRVSGDRAALVNLRLVRSTPCQGVMLKVLPVRELTVADVTVDGGTGLGSGMNGIELAAGPGTLQQLRIRDCTVRNLEFGLFQASTTTTTSEDLSIDRCRFSGNTADDLEFNAPTASMQQVTVRHSVFAGGGQFGIGLANVQHATLSDNSFSGYAQEPVHIEDRSGWVQVTNNSFRQSYTRNTSWSTLILIINGSHDVAVTGNTFDSAPPIIPKHCVYVGPGGSAASPSNIVVSDNTFKVTSATKPWGIYGGQNITTLGNRITSP